MMTGDQASISIARTSASDPEGQKRTGKDVLLAEATACSTQGRAPCHSSLAAPNARSFISFLRICSSGPGRDH